MTGATPRKQQVVPPNSPEQPSKSATAVFPPLSSAMTEGEQIVTVVAVDASTGKPVRLSYTPIGVSGKGSFGIVSKAMLVGGGKGVVAIKKCKQDRRFRNRELAIMQSVSHPNIIKLRYYWQESSTMNPNESYLSLVLDHVPETIYRHYRNYIKQRRSYPEVLCKLFLHQLLRAMAYLHSVGIMHRDLKPHNILVNPAKGTMMLIDFGSAKVSSPGELNVSYTCSRYYRAPELIFGSTNYNQNIDLWSTGCILGELLKGSVFFPGESTIDQLVEIIKCLGTPTRNQVNDMNPSYSSHIFPSITAVPFAQLLPRASESAIDLLTRLLRFEPHMRLTAVEGMCHPFFDELKIPGPIALPEEMEMPPDLFNFSRHELSVRPDLIRQLVPPHKEQLLWDTSGIDLRDFVPMKLESVRPLLD